MSEIWPMYCAIALALYVPTFSLISRNSAYQETIMHRLKEEAPLDDIVHAMAPLWMTGHAFRKHTDSLVFLAPGAVLILAFFFSATAASSPVQWLLSPNEMGFPAFFLEFGALGLYKQVICFSTRLNPATQTNNVRKVMGVATSSWTDYGISGHTGFTVLVYLHLKTFPSLLLALGQTVVMVMVRDHYTIDVLHAWTFCFAVIGKFGWLVDTL